MRLLDRYVVRNFLQVYLYCIAGFISIWLIFDISDNISTFIEEHIGLPVVAQYYATQVPQIFIILLPVSLLLALLFTLGRMSRANEIVSMLTAGISLPRVLLPLMGIGLLTVGVSMALNYSLAPHAELARKAVLSMRQAPPHQVVTNQERRQLPYALRQRALEQPQPPLTQVAEGGRVGAALLVVVVRDERRPQPGEPLEQVGARDPLRVAPLL